MKCKTEPSSVKQIYFFMIEIHEIQHKSSLTEQNLVEESLLVESVTETHSGFLLPFSNDTLWNSLEEPNIINTREFEDLFAKTITHSKRKLLSEAYEKRTRTRKVT